MAQRATVLAEKAAAATQPKRSGRSRASSDTTDKQRPIPIDLRKVVAPHKKRGRLTLRMERMPANARFSAGRNNGDGSWSLALDELEDLEYVPGGALKGPVLLAIRIIAVESSSAVTVAVVDYEISADGGHTVGDVPENSNVAEMEQLRRLRDELGQLADKLADSEAELEDAKAETKEARAELARARAAWNDETDGKIASAEKDAEAKIARNRTLWQKELDARIAAQTTETEEARAKAGALDGELKALRKSLAERETELKQARANAAAVSSQSERSVREAISTAEKLWKAGEAQRLAAAEAKWREESERALAQARTASATSAKGDRDELTRQRNELASLRKTLTERDADIARLRAATANSDGKAEAAIRDAVAKAEQIWKTGESLRLSTAEERWREQTEKALDDARAAAMKSAREEAQSERDRQRDELTSVREQLSAREAELAQLRATAAGADTKTEQAIRDAIAKAREDWKAGEAQRLAEAQAKWREETDRALAEARTAAAGKAADEGQSEIAILKDELANLRTRLSERDDEFTQLQSAMAQAAIRQQREMRDAVTAAEETWKAGEAQRLVEAHAKWRAESERTLAQARESASKTASEGQDALERVHVELADLRTQLAERDGEVTQLQSEMTEARERHARELQETLSKAEETWKAGEAERLTAAEAKWREQSAGMQADLQAQRAQVEAAAQASAATASEQHASELRILREQLSDLQQTLATRDAELEQARTAAADMQARAQQDIDVVRATAEREARERFNARLAEATARYETAESALVDMRMRGGGGGTDADMLRDEISTLRKVLANREAEIAQYRSAPAGPSDEPAEYVPVEKNYSLILAGLAAACVVMAGILFFPQIVSILPYGWQVQIYEMQTGKQIGAGDAAKAPSASGKAATAKIEDTVVRDVNLRVSDSIKSNVLMKLSSGMDVAELGTKGDWTHVRVQSGNDKSVEGWVFNTFLKAKDGGKK